MCLLILATVSVTFHLWVLPLREYWTTGSAFRRPTWLQMARDLGQELKHNTKTVYFANLKMDGQRQL
eukprot:231984-Amphidinium_carterae.1